MAGQQSSMKYIATVKSKEFTIEIDHDGGVTLDGEPYTIDFRQSATGGIVSLLLNNRSISAVVEDRRDHWDVLIAGDLYAVKVQDEREYRLSRMQSSGYASEGACFVASPMPGIIVSVPVQAGDPVRQGEKVVILESMKMENELRSPCDGIVTHVFVTGGESVDKDQPLVEISEAVDGPDGIEE